jgi:hypothetical protein
LAANTSANEKWPPLRLKAAHQINFLPILNLYGHQGADEVLNNGNQTGIAAPLSRTSANTYDALNRR